MRPLLIEIHSGLREDGSKVKLICYILIFIIQTTSNTKSLSSIVINEMLNRASSGNNNIAVAYAFCDFQDHPTLDAINILGSLAKQICSSMPGSNIPTSLQSLYDKNMDPRTRETKRPTITDLISIIGTLSNEFDHVYFVIDALDECQQETLKREIFPTLQDLQSTKRLSLFVTSRPEKDIPRQLRAKPNISANKTEVTPDIAIYVESEVKRNHRLAKLESSQQRKLVRKLVDGAEGM